MKPLGANKGAVLKWLGQEVAFAISKAHFTQPQPRTPQLWIHYTFSYTFVTTGSFTQTDELNYLHLLLLRTHYVRVLFETLINLKTIIFTKQ